MPWPFLGHHEFLHNVCRRVFAVRRLLLTKRRPAARLILMIDDLAVARAIHVLAVVHWIGGMAAVTMIVLPRARLVPDPNAAIASFETFERRFAQQARISVTLTGVSGIYMLWRLAAWERFESSSFWWLHLMVALWILFVLMLFVLEPLGIDRLFRSYARREKEHAFVLATRLHWASLLIAALTIGAGVLGAHGYLP
jgi:uncharacterized membrane protein